MKRFLPLLFLPAALNAQNPIINTQFTADPTAKVFNGKVYLYPSHDIVAPSPFPEGMRKDWFAMEDYHVFSSEDLVKWKDHGVIVTQNKVPWVKPDSYAMWAPDCVKKDGRYYFFFPATPKEGMGFKIGVAVSDSPEGPFKCENEPIEGISGIDPCVLVDDDGQSYIYWQGMGLKGAKLSSDMKRTEGAPVDVQQGLPDGFKEGPYAFKRNGIYYLTFPWVREKNGTETLAYATSRNPLGPFDFKGIIMAEHASGCWTNHHSIIEYKGQWYIFYHHNDYSPEMDKRRSTRIEKLYFNADGTIKEVKPTMRGVGTVNALYKIEADRYTNASNDVKISFVDTVDKFSGWSAELPKKGSFFTFSDVDFSGINDGYVTANVKPQKNTSFVIRDKNQKGKVIAEFKVVCITDGQFKRDYSNQWLSVTAPLQYTPKGVTDLYITTSEGGLDIDNLQFKNREKYFSTPSSVSEKPDNDGFIRRWLLLEPIDKPNPTNTVFVDTYLRETFNAPEFKKLYAAVPSENQKVKYGSQTLTWHKLQSENYNVKLFRFAEKYSGRVYGVLFSCTTVIECDKDIENVRLAAGSNSASAWYLNGEEILLMSGDRRMVKDDCVSKRITLKKGTNILSGAIINGPGMSDFCVRFIDENEKPVKDFKIK